MRYPKGHREQTRQRIVEAASRAFRAEGVAEVSIGELMHEIGLTHGGFYAHFPSKEALVAEACHSSLSYSADAVRRKAAKAPAGKEIEALVEAYITAEHRDSVATGCVMPALAGEIAREGAAVRHGFTEALCAYLASMTAALPDAAPDETDDRAFVLVAGMVGSVLLARAVDDPELSDRMLDACRAYFSTAFTPEHMTDDAPAEA